MKKVTKSWVYLLAIMGALLMFSSSCTKKNDNNNNNSTGLPVLTTSSVSDITQTTATCGGNITLQGTSEVIARGICWSTSQNPSLSDPHTTNGSGIGSYTSTLTALKPYTTYYIRAYATNSSGTGYGSQVSFMTQQGIGGTVTDIDGNVYHTITIGTQEWMAENLKVTHYRNGDAIDNVTDNTVWNGLIVGAYCWFNNDQYTYKTIYGALYNCYALSDNRGLSPAGWHIPSDAEWTMLTNYMGGESVAGGKMKSIGTVEAGNGLWQAPNTGATNESGFSALPGGSRFYNGGPGNEFVNINIAGYWWSGTETNASNAWYRGLGHDAAVAYRANTVKTTGFSVRCVKD